MKNLKINCENCCGLCCVSLFFAKVDGFPYDKDAGLPCKNMDEYFKCKIHSELVPKGMKGCLSFDCFGAGQKVTALYKRLNWSQNPEIAQEMFLVFNIMQQLNQMLWYLKQADLEELSNEIEALTNLSPKELAKLDLEKYHVIVYSQLKEIVNPKGEPKVLLGKDFGHSNLDGEDFSGACLIASNLEGCSLDSTIFLGADMRDVNIRNTDLSKAGFLTQWQINSAKGNINTKLPAELSIPITYI